MLLNRESYKDKVYACWLGKNIGGTIGGPYEGKREILDVKGFATKPREPLPNDDLDLQLIWLHAVEQEGAKNITAEKLGEYWLSFIPVAFSEYGIARSNMQAGIMPPICGDLSNNVWKHSNGAWIRTEIWATLAPGMPDIAVRYAVEDAKVDHGTGEGTYAAMFVAALESAAFVLSDLRKLIEVGLSKIPAECRVAKSVRLLLSLYDGGKSAVEARNAILKQNEDIGDGWFQAPSNVAYAVLGLLYGEGDFKKSMLTAINCGDDTDCTAATVGSIFGIMNGSAGIPSDWREHIGDEITTCCINLGVCWRRITSCTQLTDRVVRLAPIVTEANRAERQILFTEFTDGETKIDEDVFEKLSKPYGESEESDEMNRSLASLKPFTFTYKGGPVTAVISYDGEPEIALGEERKLTLTLLNNVKAFGNQPYTVRVKVIAPQGFECDKTDFSLYLPHWTALTPSCKSETVEITVRAVESPKALNRIYIGFSVDGRYAVHSIPVVYIARK